MFMVSCSAVTTIFVFELLCVDFLICFCLSAANQKRRASSMGTVVPVTADGLNRAADAVQQPPSDDGNPSKQLALFADFGVKDKPQPKQRRKSVAEVGTRGETLMVPIKEGVPEPDKSFKAQPAIAKSSTNNLAALKAEPIFKSPSLDTSVAEINQSSKSRKKDSTKSKRRRSFDEQT